jgi:dihydroorotase
MRILIKKARVIDPANGVDNVLDMAIEQGKIKELKKDIRSEADIIIDAAGKIAIPGMVDIHVHLREPGREDKETVETASGAAVKGGITTLVAMPNTSPAIDCRQHLQWLQDKAKQDSRLNILVAAAITKGRLGRELTDITQLKKQGAVAITDDGASVEDEEVMREALRAAAKEDMLVMCHCQDHVLSKNGVVNEGFTSTKLGLRPISNASEFQRVQRDIKLAKETGARVHIQHASCKESIEIIAAAKREGVKVSAETAPHYFSLSEEAVWGYDTDMKMNPPLRSLEDVEAVKRGLREGVIDAIASDHAPHTINEKAIEFERAAFGVIGLETELAVSITELVNSGILSWEELVRKIALNPARLINSDRGTLGLGVCADVVIISPQKKWLIKKSEFISKSSNSCFSDKEVLGLVEHTISRGKILYSAPN